MLLFVSTFKVDRHNLQEQQLVKGFSQLLVQLHLLQLLLPQLFELLHLPQLLLYLLQLLKHIVFSPYVPTI